jgi:uncharacterized protein YkwD
MRVSFPFLACLFVFLNYSGLFAQDNDSLSLAGKFPYMSVDEREMIREINLLRSDPPAYTKYIKPYLESAEKIFKENGRGPRNYSLRFHSKSNGIDREKIDTTWHYTYEEEVKAIRGLMTDLKKLKNLSILVPDSGIYIAAKLFAEDQDRHEWKLAHRGSDGSWPWERITLHSPSMQFGNENIAGNAPHATPRQVLIQLLIDSGIPSYGHRYNILDPRWTHIACKVQRIEDSMSWWLQEFGETKK